MPTDPPAPSQEFRPYVFHYALRAYHALPSWFRKGLNVLLFGISPDVPVSLTDAWRDAGLNAVFSIAASLTFIMSFVVVAVWSAFAGTLYGSDSGRIYFLKDWVNLLNYAMLCPLYIGFGAVLIATTVQGWARLNTLKVRHHEETPPRRSYGSMFLILLISLCAAFFMNAQFMAENMNPTIYPRLYWFVDHIEPNKTRVMGSFGFYYGFLNFCLMLFSILVAATFISQFRLLIEIGRTLDRLANESTLTTEMLRARLTTFTQSYLAGKLAVAAYMVNARAWKTSQMHHSIALVVYGGILTLFGVVFLSLPRYYVELLWFHLRTARRGNGEPIPEYDDLRPLEIGFVRGSWKVRVVAGAMDALIISSFITSFW
jgi:hypothetical protein